MYFVLDLQRSRQFEVSISLSKAFSVLDGAIVTVLEVM